MTFLPTPLEKACIPPVVPQFENLGSRSKYCQTAVFTSYRLSHFAGYNMDHTGINDGREDAICRAVAPTSGGRLCDVLEATVTWCCTFIKY